MMGGWADGEGLGEAACHGLALPGGGTLSTGHPALTSGQGTRH